MKIILVDDEPVVHLIMRKMLLKVPGVEVVREFTDTQSAAAYLQDNPDIGLVLVDISMPGESGLAFAAKMEAAGCQAYLVFVTSHKEYALEAFELSVRDYLVKPVSQERLERAVHRAMAAWSNSHLRQGRVDRSAGGELIVTTLGDFSVGNERGRVKWISSKSAELFAYLLLNRGKRVSRSRLIADIFGGMLQDGADKYLNTAVYQLRKSLEPLGLRDAVRSENDGYALELADAVIDYERFNAGVSSGDPAGASLDELEGYSQTERLYTGDLFGSKAYVWAIHETERLIERHATFAKRLAEALLANGDIGGASKLLLKLNARDPLDETIVGLLMKLHWQSGNKKALTVRYTEYVKLLERELGVRPSKELLLLYDGYVSSIRET